MAYLGNAPARSFISFERQVFTIVNSQTAYTLSHSVTNENDIRLVVNNVVQEPGSGKAYTASGTTLTLSAALTNGTDEMYCVFLGRATATNAPAAGSVGTSQLASDAVTEAEIADGAVENEHLNVNVITGQTAETSIATDATILIHDTSASALRKMTRANFVSGIGGVMTPAFETTSASQQSLSTASYTKIVLGTESFDTDGKYDASAGRFTPTVAGKYYVYANVHIIYGGGAGNGQYIAIYKNGSLHRTSGIDGSTVDNHAVFAVLTLDSDDYVELYAYSASNSANVANSTARNVFGAYKIIE